MFAKKLTWLTVVATASLVLAACGSSDGSSEEPAGDSGSSNQSSSQSEGPSETQEEQPSDSGEPSESEGSSDQSSAPAEPSDSAGSGGAVSISIDDFTADFSAMATLKPVAEAGQGKIAVLLPDTVTSSRYTEFDLPYLTQAFKAAGLTEDQFSIVNAQASTSSQLTQAQTAISAGATVLAVDPLDSGTGAQIEKYAKAHGVPVIDYDRLTLGGTRDYYVSFDNVKVGELIGEGFVQCVKDWGVKDPKFIEMKGSPKDNNATLFAQGYDSVVDPLVASGDYERVAEPAGTWDPPKALTLFQQAMTANPDANAAIVPNDANAAPIITYLKTRNIPAETFPITGQDSSIVGLQNILSGYQCGTVYKPIYLEAQATVALALYLRAGQTPPDSLVNSTTPDSESGTDVPSVLMSPVWVTAENMNETVIKDQFVDAADLCTEQYADACTAAGISF